MSSCTGLSFSGETCFVDSEMSLLHGKVTGCRWRRKMDQLEAAQSFISTVKVFCLRAEASEYDLESLKLCQPEQDLDESVEDTQFEQALDAAMDAAVELEETQPLEESILRRSARYILSGEPFLEVDPRGHRPRTC